VSQHIFYTRYGTDIRLELQQEQPQFYENLMKQLDSNEQQVLQAAVQQADVVAQQAAQAASTAVST